MKLQNVSAVFHFVKPSYTHYKAVCLAEIELNKYSYAISESIPLTRDHEWSLVWALHPTSLGIVLRVFGFQVITSIVPDITSATVTHENFLNIELLEARS